jgi:acyl transferase domain-containing protein
VFVYSGEGSQWVGMGRRLLAEEPVFAAAIADLEPVFVEAVGFSLEQALTAGEPVHGTARVQPVLVGLQLALTALWRSYGVHPDAVIGHSMGEVSAAVVAGGLSTADGLRVIATRARLLSRLDGQGAVALLKLDPTGTEALLARYPEVSITEHLSPRQTAVAGAPPRVDAVIDAVIAASRPARRTGVEVAAHTPVVDEVLPEIASALAGLSPAKPTLPFLSTVVDPGEPPVLDARYWMANVRQPVRFSRAVHAAARSHSTFIEVSPHPLLTRAITEALAGAHRSIATLTRDGDDTMVFHANLNTALDARAPSPTPWHHSRQWVPL